MSSATGRPRGGEPLEFFSAVLLVSKDPERLVSFYRDILGIPLEPEGHEGTLPHWGCTLGDLHFAIHPVEDFPDGPSGAGAVKIAFTVFDIQALARRLREKGARLLYPPKDTGYFWTTAVEDPDGNFVEFTELCDEWFETLASRRTDGIDVVRRWREARRRTAAPEQPRATKTSPDDRDDGLRDVLSHYAAVDEAERLRLGAGLLEFARTREIVRRYLPRPPAVVLDVGGGPGAYACWLAREGYEVHLVDPVPRHVEQARLASEEQRPHSLASVAVGDARSLKTPDGTAHAVLLFGPLYHLTARPSRLRALREARRVLRPRGIVLVAAISRFASVLDGLVRSLFDDPRFGDIAEGDLRDGVHRNRTEDPRYFTTAYFHRPEELGGEVEEAGLAHEATLAIEGPGWLLHDFAEHWWPDERRRQRLMEMVRRLENEPSLLGASAHLMAVGRRTD